MHVQEAMIHELGTHDTPRFITRCGANLAKFQVAMIFQVTDVGTPTIYNGGAYGTRDANDSDVRRTFDWPNAPLSDTPVALAHELISIRSAYPALRTGSFMTRGVDNADEVYACSRFDASNRIALVLNSDSSAHGVTLPVRQLSKANGSSVSDLLSRAACTVSKGSVSVNASADSGALLE